MARSTVWRVLSTTLVSPFATRDTVCDDTLARRATSAIETARRSPTVPPARPPTYAVSLRRHPASPPRDGPLTPVWPGWDRVGGRCLRKHTLFPGGGCAF